MRRLLVSLTLLAALLALPATGQARTLVGVSDQQASTFSNPLYAPLKLKIARYITSYDVMSDPKELPRLRAWIRAAEAANQRVLISFEHSYIRGRERRAPSRRQFERAIRAFRRAFPQVRELSPWNEANRCQRVADGTVVGQPTCRSPKKAAEYYMATRKICPTCRIVGLDILDQSNVRPSLAYVKRFLRYAKPRPRIWGLHNYSDTNRFSTTRTRQLLKATGSGEVWLTETGGIYQFGRNFPPDARRAARALGCMFTLAKQNKRITRLYIYQFNGAPPGFSFDAGLINVDNTTRPGYDVVKKRKARACRR